MYDYHRFHLSGAKFRGKNTAKHENYVIIYLHIQLISSSLLHKASNESTCTIFNLKKIVHFRNKTTI